MKNNFLKIGFLNCLLVLLSGALNTGCSNITEYGSESGKQKDCTGDNCYSVKPGTAAGNIVLPNYTNAAHFFRDALSLPKTKSEMDNSISMSSFSKVSQIYSEDLQGSRDNIPSIAVAATLTSESLFSYQKYAIAACTDFVNLKTVSKSTFPSGSLIFNVAEMGNVQSASTWESYFRSLASAVWGKNEISAAEISALEKLRLGLVNEEKLNLPKTAIYLCTAILLSPNSLVN